MANLVVETILPFHKQKGVGKFSRMTWEEAQDWMLLQTIQVGKKYRIMNEPVYYYANKEAQRRNLI
jgi:hypothetical protein